MKIDNLLLTDLRNAVKSYGSAANFSALCGIGTSNISRYINGKVRTISDENWHKLVPFIHQERYRDNSETRLIIGEFNVMEWQDKQNLPAEKIAEIFSSRADRNCCRCLPTLAGEWHSLRALRIRESAMSPLLQKGDIILVKPVTLDGALPLNRIVVAVICCDGKELALCRRLRRTQEGTLLFCGEEESAPIYAVKLPEIRFMAVAVRKISEL